jgi:glycosyltransferase involved in cell wall biosynthesis
VVRDGVEGFLVPIGNLQAVAHAIEQLAADPALRARMGDAANKRFLEKFTEAAVKDIVTALYRAMLRRAA